MFVKLLCFGMILLSYSIYFTVLEKNIHRIDPRRICLSREQWDLIIIYVYFLYLFDTYTYIQ